MWKWNAEESYQLGHASGFKDESENPNEAFVIRLDVDASAWRTGWLAGQKKRLAVCKTLLQGTH